MKIVIVGNGKVGNLLAAQLCKEDHDIVVVDQRESALQHTVNTLDVIAVVGNGASYDVQMEAGVDSADLLIAVTNSDELNILCCLVAKKLGAAHTIARVRNPEYTKQLVLMREEMGLSLSVNPELAAAHEVFRTLRFPEASKVETFAKGRVELVEFRVQPGSPLVDQPLFSLYRQHKVKVLICAIQRGERVIIPDGNEVLRSGDRVHLTASHKELAAFFKSVGVIKRPVKDVMVIGGSRIAYYLTRMASECGMRIKIVERKHERCMELCQALPKARIIEGDGSDQELLLEEGLRDMDAFVALTGMDEENLILSMYAGMEHVGKVIAKVDRQSYMHALSGNIETVISPKAVTANQILRYVRAMQNSVGSNVETLYRLVEHQVEALEFKVRQNAQYLGVPLKNLRLKQNLLVACILRKGRPYVASGDDTIELGDSVIVVTTNTKLKDLTDILADVPERG